jgi:mycoredoxin
MPDSQIIVYGTNWCGDCRRARKFLDSYNIPYQWINIDHDNQSEQVVIKINRGMRIVPTILFPDGTILVEPSNSKLAEQLNKFSK